MVRRMVRRAQGMTEYIIIVGLVAILLVAAVTKYKDQIELTIMGTTGTMKDQIETPLDGGTSGNPNPSNNGSPSDGTPAGTNRNTGQPVYHDGNGGYRDAAGNSVSAADVQ